MNEHRSEQQSGLCYGGWILRMSQFAKNANASTTTTIISELRPLAWLWNAYLVHNVHNMRNITTYMMYTPYDKKISVIEKTQFAPHVIKN